MVKKISILYILLAASILLQNLFFHVVNPTSTTTLLLILDIFIMFGMSCCMKKNRECNYLYRYILLVFIVVLLPQTIYGFSQGQTMNEYIDVIKGPIYILLSVPVLKLFMDDKEIDRVVDMIALFTVISLAILLLNSVVLNNVGRSLLPFDYFQMPPNGRNHRLRLLLISDFLSFVSIYSFANFIKKRRLWSALCFAICLGAEFYIEQTRVIEMSIIAACVIIFSLSINKKRYKYLLYIVASFLLIYGFFSACFGEFFDSFSVQNSTTGVSTLYRTIEWKAAWNLIAEHPFLGTGMVRNYRFSVNPTGVPVMFDHTDIGIIGTITYIGLIGTIVLFVAPYVRCFKTFVQVPNKFRHDRDFYFYTGLYIYVTVTAVTIIITDNSRIFAWPFILAVEEFIRKKYIYGECS